LNIKAYLERINYNGSLAPTAETLRALQVAHLLTVPFENLSIHAGQPIVLEDGALFTKIVENRRGGFCYEANGLFAALLRALGFEVAMLSAQVANAEGEFGPEFDHMTLMVKLEQRWLVDVGFGDSFLEPLLLDERGEQVQGNRAYRILSEGNYSKLMRRDEKPQSHSFESHSDEQAIAQRKSARGREGGLAPAGQPAHNAESGTHESTTSNVEWKVQYRFTLQPYTYPDYAEMCHYHQTSPQSHFTRSRICSRATEDGRITLSDMRFITTSHSSAHQPRHERTITSEHEYTAILREQFGIVMTN
jgi:N-hydroxyarylamine O-acetyltransferase